MDFNFLIQLIIHQGIWLIFVIVMVESMGLPFPTEAAYLAGNYLISAGRYNFYSVLLLLVIAQLIGSAIAYFFGFSIRKGLIKRFKGVEGNKIDLVTVKVTGWYKKYGSATVFATRLIGYVRPWSSIVAGIADFPIISFILWTIIGSVIYTAIYLFIAKYIIEIWVNYPILHIPIIIVGIVLFSGTAIYGLFRKYKSGSKTS